MRRVTHFFLTCLGVSLLAEKKMKLKNESHIITGQELELEQQALPRRIFLFLLNTTRTVRTVRKPFLCVAFTSIPNLQLRDRKSVNKAITHRIPIFLVLLNTARTVRK